MTTTTEPATTPVSIPAGPRFIANRAALLAAVTLAYGVAKNRTPKPILQCVMIEVDGDKLIVRSTDMEISVRSEVTQVQIESVGDGGRCLVKAETLQRVLSQGKSDTVKIDAGGGNVMVVTDDKSVSNIPLNPPDNFPPDMQQSDPLASVTMPFAALASSFRRASVFTQKDATRYAFNGVLVKLEPKRIDIVATDGRRLFVEHGPVRATGSASAIVPTKAINQITAMQAEEITVSISSNSTTFSADGTVVNTTLIEGQFPPYEDIIPKDFDKFFTVAREEFAESIGQSTMFCTEESKGVRLSFSRHGVVITTRSPDIGSATVNCPGKWEGADMEIGVNPTFLLEALDGEADEVKLSMSVPHQPILITDSTNARILLMLLNLAWQK